MYTFAIRKSCTSEKLLIEFQAQPYDKEFHWAIRNALETEGFVVETTEHGIWAFHPDGAHAFAAISIDSDAWFTFGEADQWGADLKRNREGIAHLEQLLLCGGQFSRVSAVDSA